MNFWLVLSKETVYCFFITVITPTALCSLSFPTTVKLYSHSGYCLPTLLIRSWNFVLIKCVDTLRDILLNGLPIGSHHTKPTLYYRESQFKVLTRLHSLLTFNDDQTLCGNILVSLSNKALFILLHQNQFTLYYFKPNLIA